MHNRAKGVALLVGGDRTNRVTEVLCLALWTTEAVLAVV